MEVNGAPKQPGYKLSSKYLPLCSTEQRRSYRFGTTWGWVNDRIFIFGWTIPLMHRSKWPYKTRFISRVPTLLESTWISDIWIQGLESTWIKFEIHFIYGAISKIVHMCCQRQKETALMIGRWCSAEKNLVCVLMRSLEPCAEQFSYARSHWVSDPQRVCRAPANTINMWGIEITFEWALAVHFHFHDHAHSV